MICLLLFTVVAVPVCLGADSNIPAARSGEYDVKAALVYNFLKFVDWPSETGAIGSEMRLCILGRLQQPAPFDALQGQDIRGKKLVIVHLRSNEDPSACQVLFLAGYSTPAVGDVLERIRGKAILTISDTEGYAEQGVMINMFLERKRVRFEINADRARSSGIRISVKLMRLASTVYGDTLNGE